AADADHRDARRLRARRHHTAIGQWVAPDDCWDGACSLKDSGLSSSLEPRDSTMTPFRTLTLLSALCCLFAGPTMACNTAFDLEAHRGGRGLLPENTLPAFANALSMGVDTLELDIGVTADGALVISHERGLNPDLARNAKGDYVATPGTPFVKL